jgi:hypothetical protein
VRIPTTATYRVAWLSGRGRAAREVASVIVFAPTKFLAKLAARDALCSEYGATNACAIMRAADSVRYGRKSPKRNG